MDKWYFEEGSIKNSEGWVLASVPYTLGDEEDRFNGRLMARSPQLYEACQEAIRYLEFIHDPPEDLLDLLREVIDLS